jgi:hypothetical protein
MNLPVAGVLFVAAVLSGGFVNAQITAPLAPAPAAPLTKTRVNLSPIYVARNDHFTHKQFLGSYQELFWADSSCLAGGLAGTAVTPDDVANLAKAARDGDPAYPVFAAPQDLLPGTSVCLDMDWYRQAPQNWTAEQLQPFYAQFKSTAPNVLLTGYYTPVWPISDYITPPYLALDQYTKLRADQHLNLVNQYLDFVCVRAPMTPNWVDTIIDFMPHSVETLRQYTHQPIYMWIRDDFNGAADDATYDRFAEAAMVTSHADGVVIWGDVNSVPKLLAACQKYLPATIVRPPVQDTARPTARIFRSKATTQP